MASVSMKILCNGKRVSEFQLVEEKIDGTLFNVNDVRTNHAFSGVHDDGDLPTLKNDGHYGQLVNALQVRNKHNK